MYDVRKEPSDNQQTSGREREGITYREGQPDLLRSQRGIQYNSIYFKLTQQLRRLWPGRCGSDCTRGAGVGCHCTISHVSIINHVQHLDKRRIRRWEVGMCMCMFA